MPPRVVDLSQVPPGHSLWLRNDETEAERSARLEREHREHLLKVERERVTFYVTGTLYVVTLVTSFGVAVLGPTPDVQKWAMSVVTLLAGGLAGFVTGKAGK